MPDQPTPSVGRIVRVPMNPTTNNGASEAPAIITRVWNDTTVNVRILADAAPSKDDWRTSLVLVESLAEGDGLCRWNWPGRV
ncbi:hypothetical protein [Streptomyces sp. NPDC006333]|uniref:hypothetical protein n=1 Tax=Streptomyces sp. NPDC006333 TaxID=3156753 RepID=UPI0033B6A7A0